MQAIIKHARNVKHGADIAHAVFTDPISFIFDRIIVGIITTFIPIPYIGELAAVYKKQILALLAGILLIPIAFTLMVGSLVTNSSLLANPSVLVGLLRGNSASAISIDQLKGYSEQGFSDTDIPVKNPFGGTGMENTITTVNLGDEEDITFDGQYITEYEQGIDIIPSGHYYATNKAYKLTGLPIIFDTLTGTTHTYIDQYGANIVEVTNSQATVKTVYVHMSQVLVGNNVTVHPGQPIGVMGTTGMSTGPHLEYQVRLNQDGSWVVQNPVEYIH